MYALVSAAKDLGIELVVYEGYSGRGMFGKTTDGVTVHHLMDLVVVAAQAGQVANEDDHAELVKDLSKLRYDNLGFDFIVY